MGFFFHIGYRISGEISGIRAYRASILDSIFNEILITKSWLSVDIIYQIKIM